MSDAVTDSPVRHLDEVHRFVEASDGTRLFVRTKLGDYPDTFPVMLLCDGILCDGFIWKYLWEDLSRVAPVAHWNYRGHGRSANPVDQTRLDIAAHAEDLMSVRRSLGDRPCVLIGHSMGVQVAIEAYRRFPDQVRGLVLECGSYGKITKTFHNTPVLELVLPKLLSLADKAPDVIRAVWSRIPPELAFKIAQKTGEIDGAKVLPEDMIPYLEHMTHVDFPMFLRMLQGAGDHSAEAWLHEIAVPTLLVAGEKDLFTPAYLAAEMAKAIPKAEILTVAGGTHIAPLEEHDLVDREILRFLKARVLP